MSGRGRGRGRAEAQSISSRCSNQTDSAAQKRLGFDYAALESKERYNFSEKNFVGDSMMDFVVRIKPVSGTWAGRNFDFYFHISEKFPNEAPRVKLLTNIWHPNIDVNGDVCLSVLRSDWKPQHTLEYVIQCLFYLFVSPNPGDPLNMDAADDYLEDQNAFIQKAQEYMEKYCPDDDAPLTMPHI